MLWTAAIVAGGVASRLGGRAKSTLPLGHGSILDRQLAVLRPLTDRILVVANDPEHFGHAAVPVVADLIPGAAALGGIYTALRAATTEAVLVVACDLPFLTGRFLAHLADAASGFDLTIPRSTDGLQPMCAVYSRACLEPIRVRIQTASLQIQGLAAEVRTRELGPEELAPYDPDGLLFFNINTQADYQRALEIAARHEDRITRVPLRRQQDP